MQPLISIIIAAYNVESYLKDALESCVSQTYKNIEIIAVDDASPDDCGEIIDSYAKKDSRVKAFHHEENKGRLSARKTGVEVSTGDYILFLDGDDSLETFACMDLVTKMLKTRADVMLFGANLIDCEGVAKEHLATMERYLLPYHGEIVQGEGHLVDVCFSEGKIPWNIWGKLWAGGLIKKAFSYIDDYRQNIAEDMLIAFVAFIFARSCSVIDNKLYNYRIGSGITTNTSFPKKETKISGFAESYLTITTLKRVVKELGCEERYESEIDWIQERLASDAAWYWLTQVEKRDAAQALDKLLSVWPQDVLLSALTTGVYRDRIMPRWELMQRVSDASCFALKSTKHDEQEADSAEAAAKQPKTVGMFYYRYYNGGLERVASELARIFVEAGIKVILLSDEEPNGNDYPFPEGTERIVLPKQDTQNLKCCMERMNAWQEAIEEYKIDTLIYHAWVNNFLPLDAMAVRRTGIPFIIHAHGQFAFGLRYRDLDIRDIFLHQSDYYRLANVIVALSEMDFRWYSALGINAVRTVNPVSHYVSRVSPAKLNGKQILWVGRIAEEKQPEEALKVIEQVHELEPDATLHILGAEEVPYGDIMRQYIKDHKMQNYVTLEGFTTDVAPYYQKASVILMTSLHEGFSMVMLESKMFGVPLVAYKIGNLDWMRHPKGVKVVNWGDSHAAAEEIVKLLRDDEYRVQMGNDARKSGEEIASFDQIGNWRKIFALAHETDEDKKDISDTDSEEQEMIRFYVSSISMGESKWCDMARPWHDNTQDRINGLEYRVSDIDQSTIWKTWLHVRKIWRKFRKFIRKG